MAADVGINIATTFTGAKEFKKAETATQKLTRNVKTLAGALGIAYGARAIVAYSRASVKAFAEDEAAATRLNRAVENLGIGFANPSITTYIANLEKSAAIADDILRPAFQGLLTTTGSLVQSQKLLNDAITISRASGVDLATVTEDLGKGYIGITKGLTKYNTGLTRAELGTKSFSELLGIILNRSAGAAEDYLTTTSYKMDVLTIATGNASEIIGEGLVDALARVGGGTEASDAATAITTLAKAFNFVTLATGTTIGGITGVLRTLKNLPKNIFEGFAGKQGGINISPVPKSDPVVTLSEKKQQEMLAKLEAASVKRNKELLALKNKQLAKDKLAVAEKKKQEALEKAALLLAQGQKLFDEEGIQLAAAAQGRLTEEERTRLALKKDIYDLEAAINEGNISAAARLANSMVANAQKLATLRTDMIGLNDIENPFTAWLETLRQMAIELSKLANIKPASIIPMPSYTTEPLYKYNTLSQQLVPGDTNRSEMGYGGGQSDYNITPSSPLYGYNSLSQQSMAASNGTVVNISVAGSVTTERDLVAAITQGLYSQQASGTPVLYSTVY
jgi:hypothetical protein